MSLNPHPQHTSQDAPLSWYSWFLLPILDCVAGRLILIERFRAQGSLLAAHEAPGITASPPPQHLMCRSLPMCSATLCSPGWVATGEDTGRGSRFSIKFKEWGWSPQEPKELCPHSQGWNHGSHSCAPHGACEEGSAGQALAGLKPVLNPSEGTLDLLTGTLASPVSHTGATPCCCIKERNAPRLLLLCGSVRLGLPLSLPGRVSP